MVKYGIVGLGFVSERHLKAIKETGGDLVCAFDPVPTVGHLDRYFPGCKYYDNFVEFANSAHSIDCLSICSPSHLHSHYIKWGLMKRLSIICEKPVCLDPKELEGVNNGNVNVILQLRYLDFPSVKEQNKVQIDYHTLRGDWYNKSWKGDIRKSGGLLMNIGVHLFDLCYYHFGKFIWAEENSIMCKNALITYNLSIGKTSRILIVNGQEVNLSNGFEDLHTKCYDEILQGRGFGIEDALPSVELIKTINESSGNSATY